MNKLHPSIIYITLFILLITLIILFIVLRNKIENYQKIVAGTVWTDSRYESPGLGWVL